MDLPDDGSQPVTADDIAVVYIARGGEGGLQSAQRFVSSYRARRAGQAHTLNVITKGWSSEAEIAALHSLFETTQCEMLPLPDDGFDLGAYFRAAQQIETTWLLCLNTHSVIHADNWVKILFDCARVPGVGAAGATGSWESHFNTISRLPPAKGTRERLNRFADLYWYRYKFPRFPNVHLRTNAFMIRRSDLLAFAARTRLPSSKKKALTIESGRSGLTAFLLRRNLRVMVCGADGRSFSVNEWPASQTYFVGNQTNLLVDDNQTRRYRHADNRHRGGMQLAAWGRIDDSV
jgi:hypothetical protein